MRPANTPVRKPWWQLILLQGVTGYLEYLSLQFPPCIMQPFAEGGIVHAKKRRCHGAGRSSHETKLGSFPLGSWKRAEETYRCSPDLTVILHGRAIRGLGRPREDRQVSRSPRCSRVVTNATRAVCERDRASTTSAVACAPLSR